ncbi:MAG: cupin domain-containing protein [Porticoccus sp.]
MDNGMNFDGVVSCNWQDVEADEAAPGITQRVLWQGSDFKRVVVFEFQPGSVYPGLDVHEPGPEQVYVISGEFNDGREVFKAGDFIHNPAGSAHIPQSETGCVLLVMFPEG